MAAKIAAKAKYEYFSYQIYDNGLYTSTVTTEDSIQRFSCEYQWNFLIIIAVSM